MNILLPPDSNGYSPRNKIVERPSYESTHFLEDRASAVELKEAIKYRFSSYWLKMYTIVTVKLKKIIKIS